jgi:1-acyl-sn-glycerol-3-phosphate acyltransferase
MANLIPRLIFNLTGWKALGKPPALKKYVVIGAPHTSNWDFVYGMCAWKLYGIKPKYLIKKELFRFPLKYLFQASGGLPVDRHGNHSLTDSIVRMFGERDEFVAIIPPEGTRKQVDRWRTGFYYVALNAKVPIVMGSMDYAKKTTFLSDPFYPTGDIQKDFEVIRAFFKDVTPCNPENFSVENIKPS